LRTPHAKGRRISAARIGLGACRKIGRHENFGIVGADKPRRDQRVEIGLRPGNGRGEIRVGKIEGRFV
jgi:hypothetical protein